MVTRVTQGHSGRPLVFGGVATFAFVVIQVVSVMRVAAELVPDQMAWHAAAAIGWLLAFAPWVLRSLRIYLSPRADGKPGCRSAAAVVHARRYPVSTHLRTTSTEKRS